MSVKRLKTNLTNLRHLSGGVGKQQTTTKKSDARSKDRASLFFHHLTQNQEDIPWLII